MKSKKKLIIYILIVAIIIAGIAVTIISGFNFDLKYQDAKRIELGIGKQVNEDEIRQIAKEVLGENTPIVLQKIEVFEDAVSIMAKDITEEQRDNIVSKVNEKYGIELTTDDVPIITVAHTRGRDIIKPYVIPFSTATLIILVYMMIRYYKQGSLKVLAKTLGFVVLMQAVLFSIMAITRIPIGRLTIPLVLTVYILTLIGCTSHFEKSLKNAEVVKNEE